MPAPQNTHPKLSWFDLTILLPLALLSALCGFLLTSTLAAWAFTSAFALVGLGFFASLGMPALLSLGQRLRFFLRGVIVVNVSAIVGMLVLFPEGLKQAVKTNGAWPARALAPYLPASEKDQVTREATRLAALVAEKLPSGPGALSYLLPPLLEQGAPPAPKGTIKSPAKNTKGQKTTAPAGSASVKFQRDGSSIVVKATFNDKVTMPLIYDTGASITTLESAAAKSLGISLKNARYIEVETADGRSRQPIVTVSSIEVGGARVEGPLEVAICEACSLSGASGLLGLNFSRAFITEINPDNGTITFRPRN